MSQTKSQQSTSMHQKARISDIKRRGNPSRTTRPIVHFATEPILSEELILNAMKNVDAKQKGEKAQKETQIIDKNLTDAIDKEPIHNGTAKQLKENEIKKAFDAVRNTTTKLQKKAKKRPPTEFGFRKVVLALACTAVIVVGIVYLVDANSPDASIKVTAMQNGINAIYPKYIPRGYSNNPVSITSESGKITMSYRNHETGDSFMIIEEYSEWSQEELYDNYIENDLDIEYTRIEESGMTIYVNGNVGAVWKDGDVLVRLKVTSGTLTKKQMIAIATTK